MSLSKEGREVLRSKKYAEHSKLVQDEYLLQLPPEQLVQESLNFAKAVKEESANLKIWLHSIEGGNLSRAIVAIPQATISTTLDFYTGAPDLKHGVAYGANMLELDRLLTRLKRDAPIEFFVLQTELIDEATEHRALMALYVSKNTVESRVLPYEIINDMISFGEVISTPPDKGDLLKKLRSACG